MSDDASGQSIGLRQRCWRQRIAFEIHTFDLGVGRLSRNSGREIQQAAAGGAGEQAMNRSPIPSVPSHAFSLSSLALLPSFLFLRRRRHAPYKLQVVCRQPAGKNFQCHRHSYTAAPRSGRDLRGMERPSSPPARLRGVYQLIPRHRVTLSSFFSPPPFSFSFYTS